MRFKEFFSYGEEVPGYDVRMLNEREARAAAAILFVGAFLGLLNCFMVGSIIFSKFFVSFFVIDFTMRVIQPRYTPSLMLGRFFVQNQIPEYVGATQKRFAWGLGFIMAWPMFYFLVIDFTPHPLEILVCIICMALLFFEAAFSICIGCKIYGWIIGKKTKHCPGGVCEIRTKDPIQKFSLSQMIILIMTVLTISYGTYIYLTEFPSRTFLGREIAAKINFSDAERAEMKRIRLQEEEEAFFEDDDF